MIANILSIAGSDPSGGAGIQADLKTFSAHGTYGMSVVTALTAQSTQGVTAVVALEPDFVAAQLQTLQQDIDIAAIKVGMVANASIATRLAEILGGETWNQSLILDPVMYAKGGAPLLEPAAIEVVRDKLLPLATVLTPNLPEAAALLGTEPATSREEIYAQAQALLSMGPQAVMLKGGHLDTKQSPDLWHTATTSHWLEGERVPTRNTHGTGCTLSSTLAALVGRGEPLDQIGALAKAYIAKAIEHADHLDVGQGHGPVHHFHDLWPSP